MISGNLLPQQQQIGLLEKVALDIPMATIQRL